MDNALNNVHWTCLYGNFSRLRTSFQIYYLDKWEACSSSRRERVTLLFYSRSPAEIKITATVVGWWIISVWCSEYIFFSTDPLTIFFIFVPSKTYLNTRFFVHEFNSILDRVVIFDTLLNNGIYNGSFDRNNLGLLRLIT